MRRFAWLLIWLTAIGGAGAAATERVVVLRARITYVTANSVYVNVGSLDGLRVDDKVEVLRGDQVVATLVVTDLSSHRAALRYDDPSLELKVDDIVRFVPHGLPVAEEPDGPGTLATPAAPVSVETPRRQRDRTLRGRIGLRYLSVRDSLADSGSLSQPALDFRLDAAAFGAVPLEAHIDVRAARSTRTLTGGAETSDSRTRIYRASLGWNPADSPWRLTLGRQITPALSALSIYDGISAEYARTRWSTALVAGSQPNRVNQGYSSETREYGGYFRWNAAPGAAVRYDLTTGLIGSYQQGEINREFVYLQGSLRATRWNLFATQEVDLNRGWRKQAGESSVSPTSTFLTANFAATPRWDLSAGYDDRRNVRLYLDLITPETVFDEQHRRGFWLSSRVRPSARTYVGLELRSDSGAPGAAHRYSVQFGINDLTPIALRIRSRTSLYENDRADGWLQSVSAGLTLGERWHLDLTAGTHNETRLDPAPGEAAERRNSWLSLECDYYLARRWLMFGSIEQSRGDEERLRQLELGVSYFF
jgi:hypothetical protein